MYCILVLDLLLSRNLFMRIAMLLLVILLFACSESGTVSSPEYKMPTTINPAGTTTPSNVSGTVVPGVTFSVVDMYVSSYTVYVIFRNNTSASLPSFYADYALQCGNNEKKYGELYFYLNSFEQTSKTMYVGSDISNCSLTISTIRTGCSYCTNDNFKPWTGTYTVSTSMY